MSSSYGTDGEPAVSRPAALTGATPPVAHRPPRLPSGGRRRTVIVLLSALAVLLTAELALRAAGGAIPPPAHWGDPFADAKVDQIRRMGTADVVFVGSSIANAGLDPVPLEELGLRSFNAGQPGTGLRAWRGWLDEVLLPELHPELVIVGVSIRDYSDANLDAGWVRLNEAPAFRTRTGEATALERLDVWASQQSRLVSRRSALRQPATTLAWARGEQIDGWPQQQLTRSGRYLGYDDREYAERQSRDDRLREHSFVDFRAGPRSTDMLGEILQLVRGRGAEPVVVRMPAMEGRLVERDLLPADEVERYPGELRRVTAEQDVLLIDLADHNDRPELFADYYHLNRTGVRTVSAAIVEALQASGLTEPASAAG